MVFVQESRSNAFPLILLKKYEGKDGTYGSDRYHKRNHFSGYKIISIIRNEIEPQVLL